MFSSKRFRHFITDPSAVIGALLLFLFVFLAVFAPIVAPQNPYNLKTLDLGMSMKPPIWMEGGEMPFLLGTDGQGRGILSTILFGCRTSLIVGFGVILLAGSFGVLIGLLAGFYRGVTDAVTMRLADIFFSFSTTLMAILMLGVVGTRSILVVIFAISLPDWVRYARVIRGNVMSVQEEDYVVAAKSIGSSDARTIFRHIFPNSIHSLFVVAAVDLAVVIMLEATLSFLGVGVPLTRPSLGMMIANGKRFIYAGNWWMIVFPGAALVGMVVGVNLLADWMREELNPKLQRGEQ
ncbi:ABC transporter permease [Candidatus Bipolaricaulota bacterium]|nr:ABC transporter permease [Candidatus Bipolaricaulota bacterium]